MRVEQGKNQPDFNRWLPCAGPASSSRIRRAGPPPSESDNIPKTGDTARNRGFPLAGSLYRPIHDTAKDLFE